MSYTEKLTGVVEVGRLWKLRHVRNVVLNRIVKNWPEKFPMGQHLLSPHCSKVAKVEGVNVTGDVDHHDHPLTITPLGILWASSPMQVNEVSLNVSVQLIG